MKTNRIWIVGGSSGIGLELVKIYLNNNFKVIVSSRTANKTKELLNLKDSYKDNLTLINLDILNDENIEEKISDIYKIYDGIDIWFFNAASYHIMDLNALEYKNFKEMTYTNYLGAVKIMIPLLKLLKQYNHSCHWIWNISLSSYFGLPKGGGYSAPKAALNNLAQSLYPELIKENINLQIINHGFVKTRLTLKNDFDMPQLMSAQETAKKIYDKTQNKHKFEIRFPFLLSSFLKLLTFLPYKISLSITKGFIK